jgi:hypothetical protein
MPKEEGQATHEHDKRLHTGRGIKTIQPGNVALYCREPGLAVADVHTGVKLVEHRVRHLHVDKCLLVDIAAKVFVVVAAEPACPQYHRIVNCRRAVAKYFTDGKGTRCDCSYNQQAKDSYAVAMCSTDSEDTSWS